MAKPNAGPGCEEEYNEIKPLLTWDARDEGRETRDTLPGMAK